MDVVFIKNVIDLLCLDDFSFVEKFQSNVFSGLFVFGDFNFSEASLAEDSAHLIILEFEFSDSFALVFLHLEI